MMTDKDTLGGLVVKEAERGAHELFQATIVRAFFNDFRVLSSVAHRKDVNDVNVKIFKCLALLNSKVVTDIS